MIFSGFESDSNHTATPKEKNKNNDDAIANEQQLKTSKKWSLKEKEKL